ncbi:MAG: ATP-dependent Clp protease adaptor protein ClpS [Phycisphaerales bacterium]|jgi:ATP-dependent Clp protease adaptor protein ClpS|nr:ATP-dependent Clp protease adaptor protein ClpS [Phycisphaerales bacterium]
MSDSSSASSTNGNSDTAVLEPPKIRPAAPRPEPRNKPRRQPPYVVIVENDPDHSFDYVILGLCKVCGHSAESASKLADEIDQQGRAAVWSGSLEVAELKRDQILGLGPDLFAKDPVLYPLGVRLEPLPQ